MSATPEFRRGVRDARTALRAESRAAVAMMRRHERQAFLFGERLLATIRVVLQEHRVRILDTGWPVVVMGIFVKMVSVLRATLTLAKAGHGRELPIMIRPALEALITLLYISEQDQAARARRWVEFRWVAQRKLMEKHRDLFRGPKNRNARRRVRYRAARVQARFPGGRFWAAGLGCGNLADMANLVDMRWHYNSIYWTGSQPTHASAIAVEEHVAFADGKPVYHMGLSGKGVHREMAAYCFLLVRGLDHLNGTFNLDSTPLIEGLKLEYTTLFRRTLDKEGNP